MSEPPAVLRDGDREVELPVIVGTEGERGLDISKLRAQTGLVTLDNGFVNTASCESSITFIDGEAGILRYRGIPIEELVSVPRRRSSRRRSSLDLRRAPHPGPARRLPLRHPQAHAAARGRQALLRRLPEGRPPDGHPLVGGSRAVDLLPGQQRPARPRAGQAVDRCGSWPSCPRSRPTPTRSRSASRSLYPDNSLDLVENFLTMMFAVPSEKYEVSHNTVVTPQAAPDPPRRPRAELLHLHGAPGRLERGQPVRLDRRGHQRALGPAARRRQPGGRSRCSTASRPTAATSTSSSSRPRTPTTRSGCRASVTASTRTTTRGPASSRTPATRSSTSSATIDALLDLALRLEEVALEDEYFVDRKLYPNVDFYSGLIYRAMGFPTQMFPVLFAMGRLPGWIAHWKEMMESPATKIGRPRQIYTGPGQAAVRPDRPAGLATARSSRWRGHDVVHGSRNVGAVSLTRGARRPASVASSARRPSWPAR